MKVFQIRQNFKSSPILAGAGFQPEPEPNSSAAIIKILTLQKNTAASESWAPQTLYTTAGDTARMQVSCSESKQVNQTTTKIKCNIV